MLCHKTNYNKFKKIEIVLSMYSEHNEIKLEIDKKEKLRELTNISKSNNTFLNSQWVNKEIKN